MADNSGLVPVESKTSLTTVIGGEGAEIAYQSVAQLNAIAIQDAADIMRNVSTISAIALGVSIAQFIETGDSKYAQAIELAQKMSLETVNTFKESGSNSADVLKGNPVGQ